jgi:hypothetical protein
MCNNQCGKCRSPSPRSGLRRISAPRLLFRRFPVAYWRQRRRRRAFSWIRLLDSGRNIAVRAVAVKPFSGPVASIGGRTPTGGYIPSPCSPAISAPARPRCSTASSPRTTAEIRRHRQRVRRDRHRQRPRRRRRRGSVRDEQRLHLLHRARRPDPHHGGLMKRKGKFDASSSRRPASPTPPRWRRPSSSIRTSPTMRPARRGRDRRRRQVAVRPPEGRPEAKNQIAFADVILLNKIDLVTRKNCARSSAHPRDQPLCKAAQDDEMPGAARRRAERNAFDLERILEIEPVSWPAP